MRGQKRNIVSSLLRSSSCAAQGTPGNEGHRQGRAGPDRYDVAGPMCALIFLLGYACGLVAIVPLLFLYGARERIDHE